MKLTIFLSHPLRIAPRVEESPGALAEAAGPREAASELGPDFSRLELPSYLNLNSALHQKQIRPFSTAQKSHCGLLMLLDMYAELVRKSCV